ncbi:unnamed protein product, partial [Ectocarpus fasciculatus]
LYLPAVFLIPAAAWLLRSQPWRTGGLAVPVSQRVNLNLGIAQYDDGQWAAAQQRLRHAVDDTDHPKAHYMLGLMYEAVGCDDLAIAAWGLAASQEPFHPGSANNLGALLRELGDREASVAVLSDAIARSRYPDPVL